jgi:hypothetical protein
VKQSDFVVKGQRNIIFLYPCMASRKTSLDKPRITRISLTEDQLKLLNRKSTTDYDREYIRKHTGTGICVMCENFATYLVTYDVGGATRIERYCERCIKSVQ